jgi:hypothetical protein
VRLAPLPEIAASIHAELDCLLRSGDVVRHLGFLGYTLNHQQTSLHE